MSSYHEPVMLAECLEALNIDPDGRYVDATFGGGGHSRAILRKLKSGKLYAFDQDDDAIRQAPDDARLIMINHNFRFLKNFMRYHDAIPVNGILADLGISSHQIDVPERGFSYRYDAELDMRMDKEASLTARDIINGYTREELVQVFRDYGEVKGAEKLAQAIVQERSKAELVSVSDLKRAISRFIPKYEESKFLSPVFQALRIEVNGELDALKTFLKQSAEVLGKGGRLVVMSYHSLEDRLVKNFMNTGNFEGTEDKDLFGNTKRPLKPVFKKIITASPGEIESNPRARSAKLRIAEKL